MIGHLTLRRIPRQQIPLQWEIIETIQFAADNLSSDAQEMSLIFDNA